jgi:hypothetical protein
MEDSDAETCRRSCLFHGLAGLAFPGTDASAKTIIVTLTSQQVANVCGKNMQTGGGHLGCTKNCGAGNKQICDFDCNNKTKQCGGQCVTCAARRFPFGTNYPVHVLNMSVKAAQ